MFDLNLAKHLAELSKIEFTEKEIEEITCDMTDIISLMDKVRLFDESKDIFKQSVITSNELRADCSSASLPTEEILSNAKTTIRNSFIVPKVV